MKKKLTTYLVQTDSVPAKRWFRIRAEDSWYAAVKATARFGHRSWLVREAGQPNPQFTLIIDVQAQQHDACWLTFL